MPLAKATDLTRLPALLPGPGIAYHRAQFGYDPHVGPFEQPQVFVEVS